MTVNRTRCKQGRCCLFWYRWSEGL